MLPQYQQPHMGIYYAVGWMRRPIASHLSEGDSLKSGHPFTAGLLYAGFLWCLTYPIHLHQTAVWFRRPIVNHSRTSALPSRSAFVGRRSCTLSRLAIGNMQTKFRPRLHSVTNGITAFLSPEYRETLV